MRLLARILFFAFLALSVQAQTSFTASWNFDGNNNSSVNNANVTASSASLTGTNLAGYPSNAISIRLWTTGGLNTGKYVEFSVTPQNYRFSITSVSFECNRSAQGPTQVALRSSQDGFSNNIGTASVSESTSNPSFSVAFTELENTVTFRLYGYAAGDDLGTLRIDNLRLNGTVLLVPLPVELISFKAQRLAQNIEIHWQTAWEKNADFFDVQRSHNLHEFSTLTSQSAVGDTRTLSRYQYTDESPLLGVNYYRLRQVDRDGKFVYSKIVAVYFGEGSPHIGFYQNPTSSSNIRVRLLRFVPSDLQLVSLSGQLVPFEWQPLGGDDYIFKTIAPTGWYWIVGYYEGQRVSQKIWLSGL
ncbi:T9SS type A sorting domain-containing protein [Runella zeae]|uniref:T9SS type A sorting domain-containing protein n=1 Tax=Runella zeae TaxID=94255 RepID=UPI0004132060|nr:T9SS type A sorting domain-containing protein [Runella zeae]